MTEDALDLRRVAVVGRPNAGKSTLVNCILGEERFVASEVAGTTMDSVDASVVHDEQEFVAVVGPDLCHAMIGSSDPAAVAAFAGTPRAIMRTTQLYCAQVFGDRQMMRALG